MLPGPNLTYSDRVLLAIGLSLGSGVLAGVTPVLRLHVGVLLGSLVATLFVYHALFWHPPRTPPSRGGTAAAIAWHAVLAIQLLLAV